MLLTGRWIVVRGNEVSIYRFNHVCCLRGLKRIAKGQEGSGTYLPWSRCYRAVWFMGWGGCHAMCFVVEVGTVGGVLEIGNDRSATLGRFPYHRGTTVALHSAGFDIVALCFTSIRIREHPCCLHTVLLVAIHCICTCGTVLLSIPFSWHAWLRGHHCCYWLLY
jgi:hypothetical protein